MSYDLRLTPSEAAALAGPAQGLDLFLAPEGTPRTGPERGIAARRFVGWSAEGEGGSAGSATGVIGTRQIGSA